MYPLIGEIFHLDCIPAQLVENLSEKPLVPDISESKCGYDPLPEIQQFGSIPLPGTSQGIPLFGMTWEPTMAENPNPEEFISSQLKERQRRCAEKCPLYGNECLGIQHSPEQPQESNESQTIVYTKQPIQQIQDHQARVQINTNHN